MVEAEMCRNENDWLKCVAMKVTSVKNIFIKKYCAATPTKIELRSIMEKKKLYYVFNKEFSKCDISS